MFIQVGIRNVFGKVCTHFTLSNKMMQPEYSNNKNLSKKDQDKLKMDIDLVDCKITTHTINDYTLFVITGFEKGMKMNDNYYAQGRCILRIYLLDDHESDNPLKLVHSRVLSDFKYDYTNIKNTKPVAFNDDHIYYFVFENNFDEDLQHSQITRDFFKVNLRKIRDYFYKTEEDDGSIEERIGNRKSEDCRMIPKDINGNGPFPMYAATVIFSSTVPRGRTNKIGQN